MNTQELLDLLVKCENKVDWLDYCLCGATSSFPSSLDPDTYQDRPQLQDAQPFPSRGVLHSQRAGRAGYAVHGPCAHPTV